MTEHVSTLKEVEDMVANNDVVVVKVGATWCLPCQKVQPLYEAEAKSSSWKALVYDISKTTKRDQDPIMTALGVAKIPFFAVFKDGKLKASKQTSSIEEVKELVKLACQEG